MKSLESLLADSWQLFKRAFVMILIGSVIFGLLSGIVKETLSRNMQGQAESLLQNVGMDLGNFQDLQRRLEEGDPSAAEEFQAEMARLQDKTRQLGEGPGGIFFLSWARSLGTAALGFGLLLGFIGSTTFAYFILLALRSQNSSSVLLKDTMRMSVRVFLLNIWIVLRTFVWIPVIGIITAIILGPRFALAPVILLKENKSIFESASLSYTRSNGFWGKIFGNSLVVALGIGLILFIVNLIIGIPLMILGSIGSSLVLSIVWVFGSAFLAIFLTKLSETVMSHT
ncbi:MAG: hypothetical protein PHH13_05725 [Candidatus Peribacteraceae bacterium]|nr:hypothetical protein [Candidatus Peribacteraceae bacterium]